jgi:hypothetical protein
LNHLRGGTYPPIPLWRKPWQLISVSLIFRTINISRNYLITEILMANSFWVLPGTLNIFFFFFAEVRGATSNSAYYGYPELWILRYPAHRYHAVPWPGSNPRPSGWEYDVLTIRPRRSTNNFRWVPLLPSMREVWNYVILTVVIMCMSFKKLTKLNKHWLNCGVHLGFKNCNPWKFLGINLCEISILQFHIRWKQ